MKFERLLEEYQQPEWRDDYLPYGFLKKRLYDVAEGRGETAMALIADLRLRRTGDSHKSSSLGALQRKGSRSSLDVAWSTLVRQRFPSTLLGAVSSCPELRACGAGEDDGTDTVAGAAASDWRAIIQEEMARIGSFVDRGLRGLNSKFVAIEHLSLAPAEARHAEGYNLELRQLEVLSRLAEDVAKLRNFSELNLVALFKILKKYGKVLKVSDGPTMQARLLESTGLGDTSRFDELSTTIRQAFLRSSPCQGLEGSLEVARLAAGLSRTNGDALPCGGRSWAAQNGERLLFFFLGSSTSLFIAICILIWLPCKQPATFYTGYFMANFCAFRVGLSVSLTLWATGLVARVCEDHFINVNFLLGVDPRCRISPSFLFLLAALLTSAWIVVFGMYVIDYKWMVLPELWPSDAYNKRASGAFVLYPLAILLLTAILAATPSRVCRNRYKRAVLSSVMRTCLAPLYTVSFADNLVGDILTSLAKPLQEVPATWCYLIGHHPMRAEAVESFVVEGSICPQWERWYLSPAIAGAPFWFRLLQCARRYADTKDKKHLLNLGKYAASLLVVIVTARFQPTAVIVFVSAFATVYAAAWDVFVDWGMSLHTAASCAGPPMSVSVRGFSFSDAGDINKSGEEAMCPGQSDVGNVAQLVIYRHFSEGFYCFAVVADVLLRFTWVLTLMPITLLADDIVQRAVLQTLLSSAEIGRRAMWAILRIENEQVTNASGFRDFLWVPLKMPGKQAPARGRSSSASPGGMSMPRQTTGGSEVSDVTPSLQEPLLSGSPMAQFV